MQAVSGGVPPHTDHKLYPDEQVNKLIRSAGLIDYFMYLYFTEATSV